MESFLLTCLMFVCAALLPQSSGIDVSEIFTETCEGTPGDLVTIQDWMEKIADELWFTAKTYALGDPDFYSTCYQRWNNVTENYEFYRETMCYNLNDSVCDNFNDYMVLTENPCGRAWEHLAADENATATYFSYNLDMFFWAFICYEFDANNVCLLGYLDLNVRASQLDEYGNYPAFIDGIATSLENQYNFRFPTETSDTTCPLGPI